MNFLRFIWRRVFIIFYLGKKHFLRSFLASLGLLLSLIIVIGILGILRPVKNQLVSKVEGSLPAGTIRVSSRKMAQVANPLSVFGLGKQDVLLGISSRQYNTMSKWPNIDRIFATQVLQKPALTRIVNDGSNLSRVLGSMRFDLMMQGVEKGFIRKFLVCMKNFKTGTASDGSPLVPMLVPQSYAEMLYAYFLVSFQLNFRVEELLNKTVEMRLGRSITGAKKGEEDVVRGRICGLVPQGYLNSVGVPLPWVKKMHRSWGYRSAMISYDQAFIKATAFKHVDGLKTKVRRMGLASTTTSQRYKELFSWLNRLDYIFWGAAIVLLVLTGIALANAFMLLSIEKKYEFGLYLVFGASPLFLWAMIFIEGAFWGFFHSMLAMLASSALLDYLQQNLGQIPFLSSLAGSKVTGIRLELEFIEKVYIIGGATLFAGVASLLPAMVIMGRKTVNLVKKD